MDLRIKESLLETDVFNSYTETIHSFEYVGTIEIYYNESGHMIIRLVSYDDDTEINIKEIELTNMISTQRIVIKESNHD